MNLPEGFGVPCEFTRRLERGTWRGIVGEKMTEAVFQDVRVFPKGFEPPISTIVPSPRRNVSVRMKSPAARTDQAASAKANKPRRPSANTPVSCFCC